MPTVGERVESFLGGVFSSVKNHDAKLFIKAPIFKDYPEANMEVTAPRLGPSGSALHVDNTPLGKNEFPSLSWAPPSDTALNKATGAPSGHTATTPTSLLGNDVVQYLLVVEDPDAPLPSPIVHGIYWAIPAYKTNVEPEDFQVSDESVTYELAGGFRYGVNRRKCIWSGPKPILDHGVHRYVFQVVALKAVVDSITKLRPTRAEIETAIAGNVIGWGMWVGTYERSLQ